MAVNLKNEIKPTEEQLEAINLFSEGDDLAIEAGAGTGKTSTLKMLGKYNKAGGQYIAFNKAIVEEAKSKFPRHIRCNTAHSLAFGNTVFSKDRLFNGKRVRSIDTANFLGIRPIVLSLDGGQRKVLSASYLGSLANRTIARFCQSADLEIGEQHIPYIDGIDMPDGGKRTWANNNLVRERLFPVFNKAWADITSPTGYMQFKHEHYLKMWHLQGPVIDAEFILFDEAQDANPVILDIVLQQDHAQKVFVGDSQQQIYSFTGAINAMQRLGTDNRTFLTQSFRFGPAIAEKANHILEMLNAELRLTGFDKIDSEIAELDEPDVILTRTNAQAVRDLIRLQSAGKGVALVGGTNDIVTFAKAAADLMQRKPVIHPELACFADWAEVQEYVRNDEDGSDLKLMVDMIDKFGVQKVIGSLSLAIPNEEDADVVISTAHKSKGREWEKVQLATDFPPAEKLNPEEMRLLYVASTRAQNILDVSAVEYLR